MGRSKWKGPFVNTNILLNLSNDTKKLKIVKRNSEIIPKFVGINFHVHNGKTFYKSY